MINENSRTLVDKQIKRAKWKQQTHLLLWPPVAFHSTNRFSPCHHYVGVAMQMTSENFFKDIKNRLRELSFF